MSITKNTVASATYITTTGSTTVTYQAPGTRAEVKSNIFPQTYSTAAGFAVSTTEGLVPPINVVARSVYTIGTSPEGTTSNPTNESNG